MSPRARTPRRLLLAALVAAVLAGSVAGYLAFTGGGGHYELTAYFPRAVSVFASSDVRVLGLPAGTVQSVEIDDGLVRVVLSIRDDVPVPADVRAQIVPQSLIGERYIQLSPAFQEGMERAKPGHEIDVAHTVTPVEPDEALAAVKEFLDSLDPDNLGRLVDNLEEDLRGNGAAFNDMLASLSDVVSTFADKDEALGRIIDSFDKLTATLVTREQQLGEVLDAFSQATQVLADERASIEGLVSGLADLSRDGLQLVGGHAQDLRQDIQTLTDAAAVIDANLSSVDQLLSAGGLLVDGLVGAYDPASRSISLRNNFSPLVPELIELLLGQLGASALCLPALDTCGTGVEADAGATAVPARIELASPVGSLLDLLGTPTVPARESHRSWFGSLGAGLRGAADTLLGVGS